MSLPGILAAGWIALAAAAWLAPSPSVIDPIVFQDLAPRAGIDFVVQNSAAGKKHQIETMIGGVAVFDYNNDGKPDIYFANGAHLPELEKTDGRYYNRLYRNNGDGKFTDVTLEAGVAGEGYSNAGLKSDVRKLA